MRKNYQKISEVDKIEGEMDGADFGFLICFIPQSKIRIPYRPPIQVKKSVTFNLLIMMGSGVCIFSLVNNFRLKCGSTSCIDSKLTKN